MKPTTRKNLALYVVLGTVGLAVALFAFGIFNYLNQ